jgi:hypothetical protein
MGGTQIALLPWVCADNYQESMKFIADTPAQILFGHLEIRGFEMHIGSRSETGFDTSVFQRFDRVYSGHFHHRSTNGNISYLGTPYEITWADYNDPRGFHIFDTETREMTFIPNPYRMFYRLVYDDTVDSTRDMVENGIFDLYTGTYVKVMIQSKTDKVLFDRFIHKLDQAMPADVSLIDNTAILEFSREEVDDIDDAPAIIMDTVNTVSKEQIRKPLNEMLIRLYQDAMSISS